MKSAKSGVTFKTDINKKLSTSDKVYVSSQRAEKKRIDMNLTAPAKRPQIVAFSRNTKEKTDKQQKVARSSLTTKLSDSSVIDFAHAKSKSSAVPLNNGNKTKPTNKNMLSKESTVPVLHVKIDGDSLYNICMSMLGMGEETITVTNEQSLGAVRALDLQQWHLKKLKRRFIEIDVDSSGTIDQGEFMNAIGEQKSPFTDRVFNLIDLDGSGAIDFEEYICVMATYCMYSKNEIMRFCFDCFDVDGSGTIDEQEFIQLVKVINNAAPAFPGNFRNALESFDVNSDGLIDYPEFLAMERRFPMIMFPAFRLQDRLQKGSLGEATWVRVIEHYIRRKGIHDYRLAHDGKPPPDPFHIAFLKKITPFLFKSDRAERRENFAIGLEMQARMREKMTRGKQSDEMIRAK